MNNAFAVGQNGAYGGSNSWANSSMPFNLFIAEDAPIWIDFTGVSFGGGGAGLAEAGRGRGKLSSLLSYATSKLALAFAIVGIAILLISYGPNLLYAVGSNFEDNSKNYGLTQNEQDSISENALPARSQFQPPVDPKLPKDNRLVIPAIGVKTEIQEATDDNYEVALRNGVWRVAEFGDPNTNAMPTILAAHRFGYLAWSNSFRHYHSFYNLPKLKVGDIVEVDWQQRKYMYEIYQTETATEITDFRADLILYTCVDLTGPERVIIYAKLMEI